MKHLNKTVRS